MKKRTAWDMQDIKIRGHVLSFNVATEEGREAKRRTEEWIAQEPGIVLAQSGRDVLDVRSFQHVFWSDNDGSKYARQA